ncbi:hypothetical protein TRIUR3_20726 [Triticum urartu]|uniref:Uncharacterized protein n=1 Tax=Triticum urartu TaxID=4572 RepID=M7YTY4_TRIUA|nr:hypothetical protein TRIUR3_20726 [Triticum urartu]
MESFLVGFMLGGLLMCVVFALFGFEREDLWLDGAAPALGGWCRRAVLLLRPMRLHAITEVLHELRANYD